MRLLYASQFSDILVPNEKYMIEYCAHNMIKEANNMWKILQLHGEHYLLTPGFPTWTYLENSTSHWKLL